MAIKVSNGQKSFDVDESNLDAAKADGFVPTIRVAKDNREFDVHPDKLEAAQQDGFMPVDTRSAGQTFRDALDITKMPSNALAGLRKIDEYTGAPVRKFVTEALTGEKLDQAPSGSEQAARLGVTDTSYGEYFGVPEKVRPYVGGNISPRDIVGAGLEFIQDPLLIGGAAVKGAKTVGKIAPQIAEEITGRSAARAAQTQAAEAAAQSSAKAGATISGGASSMEQGGSLFSKAAPRSLDELKNWNPSPGQGEIVGKGRLKEIEQVIPDLEIKPLKYHHDMMENPKAMKELKLKFENLSGQDKSKMASYNQEIVNESTRKINQVASDLGGGPPRSIGDAGYDVIASAKEKYNAEKNALGPVFQKIQERSSSLDSASAGDLIQAIGENSKVGKLLQQNQETGQFFLAKNTPRSGISDAEHSLISRVIDDLNAGMTFKEIQDTREFLRKAVDPMNPGATPEINKVRSIMLGQLENLAGKYGDDVGQTFKAYAVNEKARENVEKIIGGKIDSFDQMFSANPEKVVQKIFSSPNYTKVMGEYLGPEKMQEVLASYINSGIQAATDSAKGFAPHTFKGWLKKNRTIIENSAPAGTMQRLEALADYGYYGKRFLDEVNPGGTAESLAAMINPGNFFQRLKNDGVVGTVVAETAGRVGSAVKQRQAVEAVNEALGTPRPTVGDRFSKVTPSEETVRSVFEKTRLGQAGQISSRNAAPSAAMSAQNEKPQKGPERWVNDGIETLYQAGVPMEQLEQLKTTQNGRALLMDAQGAKQGSKRLDSVLQRIRTASQGGQ